MNASVPSVWRWKSQDIRPSAKKFFDRSASRDVIPSTGFSASTVIDVSATSWTWKPLSESSASGLSSYPAFWRLRSLNASVLTITMPPCGRSLHVRLQRGRVHRHEHVRLVARREDVVVGEVHLEAGDTGQRARGRADLGGVVGERREIVAHHRRLAREPVTRQLHSVAGVPGEPDDDSVEVLDGLGAHGVTLRMARYER